MQQGQRMAEWIIVGAGFTGATLAERIASVRGEKVVVVDRRPHIGGNAYDEFDPAGILVHRYGPHIFHTNSDQVWTYLSRFTEWRPYEHKVLAEIDGRLVPVPFNLNSIDAIFAPDQARRYTELLLESYREGSKVPILKLMREAGPELRELATFIYDKVFANYTLKQWGIPPEDLSPSVTARVPVVVGRDDRYFQDTYQAMPAAGYTALFSRLLDHPKIEMRLGTEYRDLGGAYPGARTIYTGPIDEYFGYRFGALPYRSLRFENSTHDRAYFQPAATVNYPAAPGFTRITEFKHLTGQTADRTTIVHEYPQPHMPGETEPYYPIPRDETQALYDRYYALAAQRDDVLFCGRLGDYKYYNMDQAVGAALALFSKRINGRN